MFQTQTLGEVSLQILNLDQKDFFKTIFQAFLPLLERKTQDCDRKKQKRGRHAAKGHRSESNAAAKIF